MNIAKWFILGYLSIVCIPISFAQTFTASLIPDSVWTKMQGRSVPKGSTVEKKDLRFLRLSYYDADGNIYVGEMVCNKAIASDLTVIFRKLYEARYPIARMHLIDDYDANDEKSMSSNNTSCFCFRAVKGTTHLSAHSRGMAVDINPLYNPCVRHSGKIEPNTGAKYALNRDTRTDIPMKICRKDLAYQLFTTHGFKWGGDWKSTKDYQHFEK